MPKLTKQLKRWLEKIGDRRVYKTTSDYGNTYDLVIATEDEWDILERNQVVHDWCQWWSGEEAATVLAEHKEPKMWEWWGRQTTARNLAIGHIVNYIFHTGETDEQIEDLKNSFGISDEDLEH